MPRLSPVLCRRFAQWVALLSATSILAMTVAVAPASAAEWTTGSSPGGFNGLSCISSSYCASLAGTLSVLTYQGTGWSETGISEFGLLPGAISCVATTTEWCLAIQEAGGTYIYNGTSWSDGPSLSGAGLPNYNLSCISSTFCMVTLTDSSTGKGYFEQFDGSSWASTSIPGNDIYLGATVSCTSTSFCAAVADHTAYTFNGTHWKGVAIPAGDQGLASLSSVSCVSSHFCALDDGAGDMYRYNGSTWSTAGSAIKNSSTSADQLSCATTTFCLATGKGYVWQYNGTVWSAPDGVDHGKSGDLQNVDCTSLTFCMLTDASSRYYVYTGGQVGKFPVIASVTVSPKKVIPTTKVKVAIKLFGHPVPSGHVAVTLAGRKLCQGPLASGSYTCTFRASALRAGGNKLVVTYPGTAYYAPLKDTVKVNVT